MCGRYSLTITHKVLRHRFGVSGGGHAHQPRFNIAPGQTAPTVVSDGAARVLTGMRWGWEKPGVARPLINARAETLAERPAFRGLLDRTRCLVPADGFYEWGSVEGRAGKQADRARLADGAPFAMAGLWRPGAGDGAFVIITTASVGAMAELHARSPVRLRLEDEAAWMDPSRPFQEVCDLLAVRPAEDTVLDPVGPAVHRADNDGPECIRRVTRMRSGSLFE